MTQRPQESDYGYAMRRLEHCEHELALSKADAANWFRQYKAMKCSGDSDLAALLEACKALTWPVTLDKFTAFQQQVEQSKGAQP